MKKPTKKCNASQGEINRFDEKFGIGIFLQRIISETFYRKNTIRLGNKNFIFVKVYLTVQT